MRQLTGLNRSDRRGSACGSLCCVGFAAALVAGAGAMSGCELHSYMDPSVVGRWEHTPTTVPILRRLDSIEDEDNAFVDPTRVQPDDLIPVVEAYRVGPGDTIELTITSLLVPERPELLMRLVDESGSIDIPRLRTPVRVQGLTSEQVSEAVGQAMMDGGLLTTRPDVGVVVMGRRQQTFSMLGAVAASGTYLIPAPDYRLLEAITAAGGIDERVSNIYVIRQAPLTEDVLRGRGGVMAEPPTGRGVEGRIRPSDDPARTERLLDLIDTLSEPDRSGSPSVIRGGSGVSGSGAVYRQPAIDLPDGGGTPRRGGAEREDGSRWRFVDGRWVRGEGVGGVDSNGLPMVTQRVIEIPTRPLLAGSAEFNIVIRPGDIVRVPPTDSGFIFMAGQVARPGTYTLSDGLTLTRALDAAGGLGALAIPERLDLTRMLPGDRQATIRLNLRAIAMGTQPDIYLKQNDRVNVGTNFLAYPLAVFRSGLRASYGFGFLLDRNFGNDVFGAPPSNVGN